MIAIGTHALIQEEVEFANLGFAIVDEQQRFGVQQRLALRMKGSRRARARRPHQLMMSATPIPRTMAMSYYADLDVSVIDELPPGRTPVATRLVSETRRAEVIQRVRDACMAGSQAYWVCPLIEESEVLQLQDRARDARRARRDLSGAQARPRARAAEERGQGAGHARVHGAARSSSWWRPP